MNIIYIIEGMFNSAGMERVVANKANYFAKSGHQVTIITTDQKNRPYYYKISDNVRCIDLDINFRDYQNYFILIRIFNYLYKSILLRKRLTVCLNQLRPDIVVSLLLKSTDFLYKINDGSAKIIEHHFSRDYSSQFSIAQKRSLLSRLIYYWRGKLEEYYLKKYAKFVVLTEEDALYWGSDFKNIGVIPNSVSFQTTAKADLKNKIVVAVGRLEYQKGFDMLLEIWGLICKKNPDWKLHIYGDGQDKDVLLSIIDKQGMSESVCIFPPVKDIQQVLLSGSIYVMTSRFEGFPMVLLEAMECALPVISFACKCGPKDIIRNGEDGFLINNNDIYSFAQKLDELMNDEVLRYSMGNKAKQNIQRYSEKEIMKKWENLFFQLIKKEKK
jgi:glycosyltransferase involved in cell wall biosynthesis